MRGALLIAALLLAGCLPGGGDKAGPDAPVTLTVAPAPDDLVLPDADGAEPAAISDDEAVPAPETAQAVASENPQAANPEPEPEPEDTAPPAARSSPEQLRCVADGGRWARAGEVGFICYQTPRDANKRCSSSDDCIGSCLAKSRTCAPVVPLIGCHEILNRSGARATQCKNF